MSLQKFFKKCLTDSINYVTGWAVEGMTDNLEANDFKIAETSLTGTNKTIAGQIDCIFIAHFKSARTFRLFSEKRLWSQLAYMYINLEKTTEIIISKS